jgi:hypothetical protein
VLLLLRLSEKGFRHYYFVVIVKIKKIKMFLLICFCSQTIQVILWKIWITQQLNLHRLKFFCRKVEKTNL